LPETRTYCDARSAVGAVWFQDKLFAVLARELEKVALGAMRQERSPIADDARPEHVATEEAPFVSGEIALGQRLVGENLPATLVIEITGERGNHAIALEQEPHAFERATELMFEGDELAGLVVAIGDVDRDVAIIDLAT